MERYVLDLKLYDERTGQMLWNQKSKILNHENKAGEGSEDKEYNATMIRR